jgi:hypothetical protein
MARSKEWLKLTPDMKLIYPLPAPAPGVEVDLLSSTHKMMNALEGIPALH